MDPILLLGLMIFGLIAGIMGALFGLGGGIILVPVLTIVYDLPPAEAAAISLIGIIATSVGAASFFVENRVSNIRLGLFLEIATALGAICGAMLAVFIDGIYVSLIFVSIMIYSAIRMFLSPERRVAADENGEFVYHDEKEGCDIRYDVDNRVTGSIGSYFAGLASSMTGIGGGAIKVPLMNLHMHVPMKAAAATSSYMIGITAFSGAIVYFLSGQFTQSLLEYAAAISVFAFLGAVIGSRAAMRTKNAGLQRYFSIFMFFVAALVLLNIGGVI